MLQCPNGFVKDKSECADTLTSKLRCSPNFSPESRAPAQHALRSIKAKADAVLGSMSAEFDRLYADSGRPSIAPERLLKPSLLIALYSVRSDRVFCEMLDYNILFRWFLDMNLKQPGLDQSNFSRLRGRLVEHAMGVRPILYNLGESSITKVRNPEGGITCSRVSLRSRSRVSGSLAASGLIVSMWPLTMPTLLKGHLVANLEKLSHSSGEPVDALQKHLYAHCRLDPNPHQTFGPSKSVCDL